MSNINISINNTQILQKQVNEATEIMSKEKAYNIMQSMVKEKSGTGYMLTYPS